MSQSRLTLFNDNYNFNQLTQDAKTENSYDKLIRATEENDLELVKVLIEQGAYTKPTFPDSCKYTDSNPPHIAAENGNLDILKILLQAKDANVDVRGGKLATPLHCAAAAGHVKVIQYLIDKGANIDAQNCHGFTALHFTLSNKKPDAAKVLIDNGANPYKRAYTPDLTTPLEWAQGNHGNYRGYSDYKNEEIADYMLKNYCHERKIAANK